MHHIAIMRKDWGLTAKILTGTKTIESRWYKNKSRPWNSITSGDTIFFQDTGGPVTLQAEVGRVLQFADLTPQLVQAILKKYCREDGIARKDFAKFYQLFKDKKYCLLIFLKNPRKVQPFRINKSGFGAMAAWITVENVSSIRVD